MFSINDVKADNNRKINRNEYRQRAISQLKVEKQLISTFSRCPIPQQNIADLKPKILKEEVTNNFYNSNVITAATCISENLITISPDWERYIRAYFTDLKLIKKVTATGNAFLTNLSNPYSKDVGKNLFVIKAAKSTDDNFYHEAIIGMACLNNLRKNIPNFACIYGFFKCGEPIFKHDGQVAEWCTGDDKVEYIIYENIENSKSIKDLLNTNSITSEKFLQYLIQLLYALKTANKEYKFTHFDCHGGNVLLRKLSQPALIKYTENIYIKTDEVLTFIDYGMSYVEANIDNVRTKLGCDTNYEQYNIFNDKDFIIHDIFKFISVCLYGEHIFKNIRDDLLSYFYIYDPSKSYEKMLMESVHYYCIPAYNNKTKNFDIDKFISYVLQIIRKNGWTSPIVVPKQGDILLSCDGNVCSSLEDIMTTIGVGNLNNTYKLEYIFKYTENDINNFLNYQNIIHTAYNLKEKRYLVVHSLYENDYLDLTEINQYGIEKIPEALKIANTYVEFLNILKSK
jgi:hypothetical protein